MIAVVSAINFRGIKESAGFNVVCTLIEIGGLFLVVVIGATFLFDGGGDAGRALEFNDDATPGAADRRRRVDRVLRADRLRGRGQRRRGDQGLHADVPAHAVHGPRASPARVYLLVTIVAGMAVPADTLADSDGPLLEVVTQGPLSVNSQGLRRDRAVRAHQRLPAEPRDGLAADVRHGATRRSCPRSSARCTAAAARRGWRSSSPRAIAAVLVILGDLTTLADTTVLLLLLVFIGVHVVAARAAPRRPSTTSTSRRLTVLPYLGIVDLRRARDPVGRRRSEARPVGRRADRLRPDPVGRSNAPCDDRRMAWDFSTEPEFQEQLDWMRDLVRDEVWPIETVFDELGDDGFRRAIAPLQERVKERGLWAAHLPPDLGGQGFGQVKLGLMHEILGTTPVRARGVRQRRAGQRQQRDPRARGHAGPEGALPAPAARGRPALARSR